MVINITASKNADEPEWSGELYAGSDDRFRVEVVGNDLDEVEHAVKGTVLCALGNLKSVSEQIEFNVTRI